MSEDEPQPRRQLVPEIPPELGRVCLKALAKAKQDRYATASEFAEDLRRAQDAESRTTISRQTAAEYPVYARESTRLSIRPETATPVSVRRAREAELVLLK